MLCPACQRDNPPEAKFCLECGSHLSISCASCDTLLPAGVKFCSECGEAVSETPASAVAPQPDPPAQPTRAEGERRQLTVMFCDLVASTELSERLDPEVLREVVRAYQVAANEAVENYEGTIAQYLGDGVLVYFGYPRAHEDDAERAVRAGLAILAGMERVNARLAQDPGIRLAVRVGIHTGPVVVGDFGGDGKRERTAFGETLNLASRLSDGAVPDSVLISNTTHHLVQGLFACQSAGDFRLKGLSHPVAGYRVLRESGVYGRLAAAAVSGLSPFVGRDQELALLIDRWKCAEEGTGQVMLVGGEAGIGKSRLMAVLHERLAGEHHLWLECRCSPYHQNSALYPVIGLLHQVIGLGANHSPGEKLDAVESALERYAPGVADAVPLLAALLSIPFEERYSLPSMTPQRQKHLTLEVLLRVLLALTEERPVVFLVEDLHWVDPSTLELLTLLVDQQATSPALVLLTYRPEFDPPWHERTHMTHLTLSRLKRSEVTTLVGAIARVRAAGSQVFQQVVEKSDGIPLFAEELTKMVMERDLLEDDARLAVADLAIPSTLQGSLMARLDRLAAEKQVAQLAACIGRAFSYELLREVAPFPEDTLRTALARLMDAELVYARGLPPRATYLFKHALIQEAAYQSLLVRTRRKYHRQIAEAIEKRLPETAAAQPELLAQHYSEAGCPREAIAYWLQAGQRALARSANEEAIVHLQRGIDLVPQLDEEDQPVRQELVMQTLIGLPLTLCRGYAAPEVAAAFGRAYELADKLGEAPELFDILDGLRQFYHVNGNLRRARELGDRLERLSERTGDSWMSVRMEIVQGAEASFSGRFVEARTRLDRAIELYDPERHRRDLFTTAEEPGVAARLYAGQIYWVLGQADLALRTYDEALAMAQEVRHPSTLAFAYAFASVLHVLCGNPKRAAECGEAAIRIGDEQGFPFWASIGTMFRGWALTELDTGDEGIDAIRRGFEELRATGARVGLSLVHSMLANVSLKQGDYAEGTNFVDEALASLEETGERFFVPELLRLRGELRRAQGAPDAEVDRCFGEAIAQARDLEALALELRAVASRSRLLRDQGRAREAADALGDVLGRFREGFDTGDLKDARALWTELSKLA
jgi:class 3 adenylate cyclase/tetratricopeptide (TPR) repeat protein